MVCPPRTCIYKASLYTPDLSSSALWTRPHRIQRTSLRLSRNHLQFFLLPSLFSVLVTLPTSTLGTFNYFSPLPTATDSWVFAQSRYTTIHFTVCVQFLGQSCILYYNVISSASKSGGTTVIASNEPSSKLVVARMRGKDIVNYDEQCRFFWSQQKNFGTSQITDVSVKL